MISPVLTLVKDVLAAHRLTRLVVEDEITADLRETVWKTYPPETHKLGYLLTCPHCTSVWASAALVAARLVAPRAARPVIDALAVAGAVSLLSEGRAYVEEAIHG